MAISGPTAHASDGFDARIHAQLDTFLQNNKNGPRFAFIAGLDPLDRRRLLLTQQPDGTNIVHCLFVSPFTVLYPTPPLESIAEAQELLNAIEGELLCECLQQRKFFPNNPLFHDLCFQPRAYEMLLLLLQHIPDGHPILTLKDDRNQTALDVLHAALPKDIKDIRGDQRSILDCALCIQRKIGSSPATLQEGLSRV